ncbi:MAG TPA: hypothetical protein VF329_01290 [Gammaproteobacteria bacterium]
MRAVAVLISAALTSGCSVLDGLSFDDSRTLDPAKVYLGPIDEVLTSKRDVDQYTCVSDRPMVCTSHGTRLDCRCPF